MQFTIYRAHNWHITRFIKATVIACLIALPYSFTQPLQASDPDAVNKLNETEKKAGWELLFNGKNTDGWRNFKSAIVDHGWKVIDGALVRDGNGAGELITNEKFAAFELALDFKISAGGNSGVMYHVTEDEERAWHSGPEIQIIDNQNGKDPQKCGWLYQLYDSEVDATKPAGEWNRLRILVSPSRCETSVNNIDYYEYVLGNNDWKERVARSKFSALPSFGKAESGHICLQDHGDLVSYRNIKIRRLESRHK